MTKHVLVTSSLIDPLFSALRMAEVDENKTLQAHIAATKKLAAARQAFADTFSSTMQPAPRKKRRKKKAKTVKATPKKRGPKRKAVLNARGKPMSPANIKRS